MRAVVQKVIHASVTVEGQVISSIGKGLMVLIGIEKTDTPDDAAWITKKVLGAKLWDDGHGYGWAKSVMEVEGEVLCVSQFTLYANFKGLKPDFHQSMSTEPGKAFYHTFLEGMGTAYKPECIKNGQFGAMMDVSLTNAGPVTMLFDSQERGGKKSSTTTPGGSGASTPQPQRTLEEGKARAKEKIAARQAAKAAWAARKAAGDVPAGAVKDGEEGAGKAEESGA